MRNITLLFLILLLFLNQQCTKPLNQDNNQATGKIRVIFDTDANNELDDQHALAYLLFSGNSFAVEGVTVNATRNGGNIAEQYAEAERILKLCRRYGEIPLLKGADAGFAQIRSQVQQPSFDGAEGVNFMLERAKASDKRPLVLLAVGKLTNVALALEKEPSIASRVRVVWLGSNYPEPGEYNQDNDTTALNYILKTNVPFEMVTVRYGKPSGTDAVRATQTEINQRMPGKGPKVAEPVTGRHQVAFTNFGDYSVNLFEHIDYHGNPPSRALFDMAAVAVVKNPTWASARQIPSPILRNNQWVEQPNNSRKITIWENFDQEKIMADFYETMDRYVLAETK